MQRVKMALKMFGSVGTAFGSLYQFNSGSKGEKFNYGDIGPQAIPKFGGRMLYGHNQLKQLEGRHSVDLHLSRQMEIQRRLSEPTEFELAEKRSQVALQKMKDLK